MTQKKVELWGALEAGLRAGLHYSELIKATGASRGAVSRILAQLRSADPSLPQAYTRKPLRGGRSKERDAALWAAIHVGMADGLSICALAEQTGRKVATVNSVMRRLREEDGSLPRAAQRGRPRLSRPQ